MKTAFVATLVIIGACAAMRPTERPYSIGQTSTRHVRGTPNQSFPELADR
jgi:hypothetical protein